MCDLYCKKPVGDVKVGAYVSCAIMTSASLRFYIPAVSQFTLLMNLSTGYPHLRTKRYAVTYMATYIVHFPLLWRVFDGVGGHDCTGLTAQIDIPSP